VSHRSRRSRVAGMYTRLSTAEAVPALGAPDDLPPRARPQCTAVTPAAQIRAPGRIITFSPSVESARARGVAPSRIAFRCDRGKRWETRVAGCADPLSSNLTKDPRGAREAARRG